MLTRPAVPSQLRGGLMWHALCMPTLCYTVCLVWVSRFLALVILALFLFSILFYSILPYPCYSCGHSSAGLLAWVRSMSQQGHTLCNVIKCVLIHHPLHYFSSLWDLGYIITLLKRKTRKRKCISHLFTGPSDLCDWRTWVLWSWIQNNLKLLTLASNDKGTWIKAMTLL